MSESETNKVKCKKSSQTKHRKKKKDCVPENIQKFNKELTPDFSSSEDETKPAENLQKPRKIKRKAKDSEDLNNNETSPSDSKALSKKTKKRKVQHECPFCQKTFSSADYLRNHKERNHKNERIPCPLCSETFTFHNNLTRHVKRRHCIDYSETDHSCERKLEILFDCYICQETFGKQLHLDAHMKRMHPQIFANCPGCSKSFPNENSLQKHYETVHGDEKQFTCEICSKGFSSYGRLIKHVKVHDPDKPFKCDQCPKSFTDKRQFQQHLANQHGAEKPFKCGICSASFVFEAVLLREHMPLHSDERPFPCDICGKRYKTKKTMLKHRRHYCAAARVSGEKKGKRPSRRVKSEVPVNVKREVKVESMKEERHD